MSTPPVPDDPPHDTPAPLAEELYDYAVQVRNSLDDDRDVTRDDLDNLLQVRKVYVNAHVLGLTRLADAPDSGSLNRTRARQLLDELIPRVRAAIDHPANRPPGPARQPAEGRSAPPVGASPFAVYDRFRALRAFLQALYTDEWRPAALPLWDALRPCRAAVEGDDPVPDPAVWGAIGAAVRAAGLGDFPYTVLAHRPVPADIHPADHQVAVYAAWALFTRAAADDPDGLAAGVAEAWRWAADAPDPGGARDRLGAAVADAAARR